MSRLVIGNWGNESELANIPADILRHDDEAEDVESLWGQAERLTALLGQYARTLTDALPALRAGDQPNNEADWPNPWAGKPLRSL
jgi:hypothetical protein